MHRAGIFGPRYRSSNRRGFKSHSTFRAATRPALLHLRMHRARVFSAPRFALMRGFSFADLKILAWIFLEFGRTILTAEIVSFAVLFNACGSLRWLHLHPANGI